MTDDLSGWTARLEPGLSVLSGNLVRLEPFDKAAHAGHLYAVIDGPENRHLWDWIYFDPFPNAESFGESMARRNEAEGWRTLTIILEKTSLPAGMFSYMRLRPEHGSAELGAVMYGDGLSRTRAGTEAFYLAARHLFEELGYRRFEWKCNANNAASARAALRYGFTYEGRFRQDLVWRGTNRDTDWYSMLDYEWPARRAALEAWLDTDNFDSDGRQQQSLASFQRHFSSLR